MIAAVDGASPLATGARLEPVARALESPGRTDARALRAAADAGGANLGGAPVARRVAGLQPVPDALNGIRRASTLARRRPGRDDARLARANDGVSPVAAGVARLNPIAGALRRVRSTDTGAAARHAGLVAAVHRRPPLPRRVARQNAVAAALGRPRRAHGARFGRGLDHCVLGPLGRHVDGGILDRADDIYSRIGGVGFGEGRIGRTGLGDARIGGAGLGNARILGLRLHSGVRTPATGDAAARNAAAAASVAAAAASVAAAAAGRAGLSRGVGPAEHVRRTVAAARCDETPGERAGEGQPNPASRIDHETSRWRSGRPGRGVDRSRAARTQPRPTFAHNVPCWLLTPPMTRRDVNGAASYCSRAPSPHPRAWRATPHRLPMLA